MAKNADGSVTLKTTGKVASTPRSGSGKGVKAPLARSVSGGGSKVVGAGGKSGVGGKGSAVPRSTGKRA